MRKIDSQSAVGAQRSTTLQTIVVQRDDGSTACISRERLVFLVAAACDLGSHIGRLGVNLPPFRRRLTTSRAWADHGTTCFCKVLLFGAPLVHQAANTAGAAISTANAAGTKPGMDSETLCWFSSTWRDGG